MLIVSNRTVGILLLGLVPACSDQTTRPEPLGPSLDEAPFHTLSGSVLGPESSICNSLPESSVLQVRVFDPASSFFTGGLDLTCPENSYAFGLEAGTYLLRVQLPADPSAIRDFPWRSITADPVVVSDADVTRDLTVTAGAPLGGHATFEGHPVEGVGLALTYDNAPFFGAATGASGADGGWSDFFGRSPMLLQGGVRLRSQVGCGNPFGQFFLATQVAQAPPAEGFLFPTERDAIDCALQTAPTAAFSHHRSDLVVTPMPGDIGGLSGELFDQFGSGWGVQLLGPGETPQHGSITFSQLFQGGLIVGIRPDVLLTGFGFGGYGDCGAACRDFGLDASLSASATRLSEKKQVTWRYSDAPSADAAGLGVVQRSYDGASGAAYVLFQFTFTNTSATPLAVYPGVFMDWDVGNADFDAFDDVGFTDRGGRLMYMTDAPGGPGTFDGTLVFGAPVAGNAVLTEFGQSATMLAALAAGDLTIPSSDEPTDHRYIHTVGPITLAPHRRAGIWVAVVSGRNAGEFFANVDVATADVARRQAGPPDVDEDHGGGAVSVRAARTSVASANPRCKRGCGAP
jgi:hypothetical protein